MLKIRSTHRRDGDVPWHLSVRNVCQTGDQASEMSHLAEHQHGGEIFPGLFYVLIDTQELQARSETAICLAIAKISKA